MLLFFSCVRQAAIQARKEAPHRVIKIDATKASVETSSKLTSSLELFVTKNYVQNEFWLHAAIPPLLESLPRSHRVKFSTGHSLFKSQIPSSISKLSHIPPVKMSASRSRQDIFIPYPTLSISHIPHPASLLDFMPNPASRQTYVGPSAT